MNLSVFVDDLELGITHVLRAKDHMDNAKRQEFLYKYFKKIPSESIFVGKINFEGMPMSCSKVRVLIEEGKYDDWSDIRLPFLAALKRRGYQPEAFAKYALDVGTTQTDKTVSKEEFFKALDHFNKEILDSKTDRYFFVADPEEIEVEGAPEQKVSLDLHPDHPKKGKRKFETGKKFFIAADDHKQLKGLTRLMDCLNFTKKGKKLVFDSTDYRKYREKGSAIIHWLPVNENLVDVEVLMPDKTTIKGLAEPPVKKLRPGAIVQFERFGFCRLDEKKANKLVFWFGHK